MFQKPTKIECNVILVLRKDGGEKNWNELRIVKWVIDGKETPPKLEKRSFYKGKNSFVKMAGAKGFTRDDWDFLIQNREDVEVFLK